MHPKPSASQLDPTASAWVGTTDSEGSGLATCLSCSEWQKESRMRVVFDTGSHKCLITAKDGSKLRLRPVRSEQLGIKAFGSREVNATRDVVDVSLKSCQGGKAIKIEEFVVDDISDIPNIHAEIVTKNYEHLTELWVSDVCRSDDVLEVGCLIGSGWL